MFRKLIVLVVLASALVGFQDDAQVATKNLSKAADNFEVMRRVVFYNTWKGEVVKEFVGKCSVKDETTKFSIICKVGPSSFRRDIIGRNESMTYLVDQLEPVKASVYYYRRTFKPQSVLPDIDIRVGKELPVSQTSTE